MTYKSMKLENGLTYEQNRKKSFHDSLTPEYLELLRKLKEERRKRKLSQCWMENYLYIGTGTFGYMERGQHKAPDEVMERWCELLGVKKPD